MSSRVPLATRSQVTVDLRRCYAGQVVEIHTQNSTYWVTVTDKARHTREGLTLGIAVQTTSSTWQDTRKSPAECFIPTVLASGMVPHINGGWLTAIKTIRVL